ncbi:MAG TPA: glucosyl transferase, partial [Saliniramus sp.]|nr:glucosyl transferase [Saliniramus sp.]
MNPNAAIAPEQSLTTPASRDDGAAPLLIFFGHDSRESTIKKRIASFQAQGWRVRGLTFARSRVEEAQSETPFWENVHLGLTQDRNYHRRVTALARAVPKILREAETIRSASVIYARNMDMMALAVLAKQLCRAKAKLVYEVLDVQRPLLKPGPAGAAMRAAERRLLASSDLLVVSAPEFVERYFRPVQGYTGA